MHINHALLIPLTKLISQDWGWSFLNAIPDDEEHEYHQHSYLLLHSQGSPHNSERLHLLEFKSDARCVLMPLVTVPQLELPERSCLQKFHNGGHSWRPQISRWTSNCHYWHCWWLLTLSPLPNIMHKASLHPCLSEHHSDMSANRFRTIYSNQFRTM